MKESPHFHDLIAASPSVFTLGVAGDSGSGKTTFTQAIRTIFGEDLVSTITLDDYHLYDREERKRRDITPLDPAANDLRGLEEDLSLLKQGKTVLKTVYNHDRGTIQGPVPFTPSRILILEGLHPLYTPRLRELLDFSLYVDPATEVKREWKIKRDMQKRGYDRGEVEKEIARRAEDYDAFIAPQKSYADALVEIGFSRFGRDLGWLRDVYRVSLSLARNELAGDDADLRIDLGRLFSLPDGNFLFEYRKRELFGRKVATLTFDGEPGKEVISGLEGCVARQTGVYPPGLVHPDDTVNATACIRIILAIRIISRWLEIRDPDRPFRVSCGED
ncbi:phosphoribulokinase [Methanolinea mesophila]|uniref:phosphoribulokinase n=1 Tax=Methanolinea mesophila TaxID=547055 RepID=UPI001AE59E47|nr:phosphoribulokinase [Methanolinea mesophila]MBP1927663.1 phosphoribulokinase [Methanolinea mesophila]